VGIGGPCAVGTTFCDRALPPALQTLSDVLLSLKQQVQERACPAFLP